MRMTKEETRKEILRLYRQWPERENMSAEMRGIGFHAWLQSNNDPILSDGTLGSGPDKRQYISAWIEEWERYDGVGM